MGKVRKEDGAVGVHPGFVADLTPQRAGRKIGRERPFRSRGRQSRGLDQHTHGNPAQKMSRAVSGMKRRFTAAHWNSAGGTSLGVAKIAERSLLQRRYYRENTDAVNSNLTLSGLSIGARGLSGLEPLGPLETGRRLSGLASVAQNLAQVSLGPGRIGAQADCRSKVRDGVLQPTG